MIKMPEEIIKAAANIRHDVNFSLILDWLKILEAEIAIKGITVNDDDQQKRYAGAYKVIKILGDDLRSAKEKLEKLTIIKNKKQRKTG